jgi:hypothetical protein
MFHNKFYFKPLHVSSKCAHHQDVPSSHSYQITIKELVITLPLHGQNTADLQLKVSGQAILQKLSRKDVFVKQADIMTFA